jgi:hypothetical protein
MRKSPMMLEAESSPPESPDHIEIRSLCGQSQRQRCQRCLAVEPGAAEARARQKMCYRFQGVKST